MQIFVCLIINLIFVAIATLSKNNELQTLAVCKKMSNYMSDTVTDVKYERVLKTWRLLIQADNLEF